jgi:hypothetical protein
MQTAQDLTLLDGGAEAFPRMVLAIEQARESVQLEMYLFRLDATGRRFVAALSAAAARGVTVRVSLDGWGSSQDAREIKAELVAAGCAVSSRPGAGGSFSARWREIIASSSSSTSASRSWAASTWAMSTVATVAPSAGPTLTPMPPTRAARWRTRLGRASR